MTRVRPNTAACWIVMGATALACASIDETEQARELFRRNAAKHSVEPRQLVAPRAEFNPRLLRRFRPSRSEITSDKNALSRPRIDLGRMLYFETRISKSQTLSCNSCHDLARYGVDGAPTSTGHRGQKGGRNAPTVYHAAAQFRQFWDGRSPDVEQQALLPILNPVEMAAVNEQYVVNVLRSMVGYRDAFAAAFPNETEPVTFRNVGRAIGAFERKLVTQSRWDTYLKGETSALEPSEIEGLKLFTNLGCMVCHTGELLGGSMYEKLGAVEAWPNQADQGRFSVSNDDGDRMMFKVPTLRNIAETAPYFHDGSAGTLDEAIRMMGKHQLGLDLRDDEVESIATWLNSLTGALPRDYIRPPQLPASTSSTPKADPL